MLNTTVSRQKHFRATAKYKSAKHKIADARFYYFCPMQIFPFEDNCKPVLDSNEIHAKALSLPFDAGLDTANNRSAMNP